ncbi:hypothetical protein ACFL52_03415 [Candidatus Margulisiibacteriota bacterium]
MMGKVNKTGSEKKYSGADVYKAAMAELRKEMVELKGKPLNNVEETKMKRLGGILTHEALKEIGVA